MRMETADAVAYSERWAPFRGWHNDHAHHDGTPAYLPAIQQDRAEFEALLTALNERGLTTGRALQLGVGGDIDASHHLWCEVFARHAVSIDMRKCLRGRVLFSRGLDTHSPEALAYASEWAPYDFLFIDAGHSFEDAKLDHETFRHLVRSGGIIAFHDALPRKGYEEVEVWRYLQTLDGVATVGQEVGTAWIVNKR